MPSVSTERRSTAKSFRRSGTATSSSLTHKTSSQESLVHSLDLRKEYCRFCKLYSSEPLDIIAGPLEKASFQGSSGVLLDLKGKGLRGVDCIALGKILAVNGTISTLNLSDCLLLPQGFSALLEHLSRNTALRVLELRGNNIQGGMIDNLSDFLRQNQSLRELLLEWNSLGSCAEQFEKFCHAVGGNKGLQVLDLRNNQIQDEAGPWLAALLEENRTLRRLDLRWNSIGVQGARRMWDVVQKQGGNSVLTALELTGNFVPEEVIKVVDSTLRMRQDKEEIIQEYSTRTKILTSRLEKTEDQYKEEVKGMIEAFQEDQFELKKELDQGKAVLEQVTEELEEEKGNKLNLEKELQKLKIQLETEKRLRAESELLLEEKEEEVKKFQEEAEQVRREGQNKLTFKLDQVSQDYGLLSRENSKLLQRLEESHLILKEKEAELSLMQERISALKDSAKKAETLYLERIEKEKENWINWKSEVESSESLERRRLQQELHNLQKGVTEHIRGLELAKAEALQEVSRLKMLLLRAKAEGDEKLSSLRSQLEEEGELGLKGMEKEVTLLRGNVRELEDQLKVCQQDQRKLEADLDSTKRERDLLARRKEDLETELGDLTRREKEAQKKWRAEKDELEGRLERAEKEGREGRERVMELQEGLVKLQLSLTRVERESREELEHWKAEMKKRDEELKRVREEDVRRVGFLHDAFMVYMKSMERAKRVRLDAGGEGGGDMGEEREEK